MSLGCLASELLQEFGSRNVVDPNERHEIAPGIAASLNRLSCHWFDLACLALLEDVVRHRTNFFRASDARDGDRPRGPAAARSRQGSA